MPVFQGLVEVVAEVRAAWRSRACADSRTRVCGSGRRRWRKRRPARYSGGCLAQPAEKCKIKSVLRVHVALRFSLNSSNAKATFVQSTRTQKFLKPYKPCHAGIHGLALAENSQTSTHLQGFQSFSMFF